MKRIPLLLALLAAGWSAALAAPPASNSPAGDRSLLIDSSSMSVTAGKATLIIGSLERTNGVYTGDYKLSVSPYFWKSQTGRLAIVVSDASLTEASQGKVVKVTGTATAKNGRSLPITAIATPVDADHGALKLWFTVDSREMTFTPAYRFAGNGTASAGAQAGKIDP